MNEEYKIKGWVARDQNNGEDGTNLYFGEERNTFKLNLQSRRYDRV